MCGICGELSNEKYSTAIDRLRPLVNMMYRRGPDDEGLWTDATHCSFGFRRLAILDLSPKGHQPMLTRDGRYVLVYNGELYNFRLLRNELTQLGIQFQSSGDTEVVLYALAEWGIGALKRFNGMFALAWYDTIEKRLLLARDHAGIKPLYYAKTPQGVFFASQYNQILQHPWCRQLEISPRALSSYLYFGFIPSPIALLENTFVVEAGSWIEFSVDGYARIGKFFAFDKDVEPSLSGQEANEAIDAAVTEAVQRQMISDVPIGSFLSGGIDSTLVTAKMQLATNQPFKTFTIGNSLQKHDESADAASYAQQLGIEHILHSFTPDESLKLLDDVVTACAEPFGDFSVFPTMLVAQLARANGIKVMLSGDGGDEIFWGYSDRFTSVLRVAEKFRQPHWLRVLNYKIQRGLHWGTPNQYIRLFSTVGEWYLSKHVHNRHIHNIVPDLPSLTSSSFEYDGNELDKTAYWLRWNEYTVHLARILLKVDRASMFHSLEVRVPLLDKEVIELALRIDWRSCLNLETGLGKLPLRASLSQYVNRQTQIKRGFSVPMGQWLRGPLRPIIEDTLLKRTEILGFPINQIALRNFFYENVLDKGQFSWGMWILLSLVLWEQKHFQFERAINDE